MTLRIAEAAALITDKRRGKYPHDFPHRQELVRSLHFASKVWGADTKWTEIDESHWYELLRKRLDDLVAKGNTVRGAKSTFSTLRTTVIWLRKEEHIPEGAAQWPTDWEAEIARYWKRITGSVRDPVSRRLQHTEEEARAILKASAFDSRFELLLWLGMDQRLGQVVRARRSDLELPPLGGESFGTLNVHGAKGSSFVVDLDAGQRAVIDRMRSPGFYLYEFEQRYQQSHSDYLLFPAGYMNNKVRRTKGKEAPPLSLSSKANLAKSARGSWIRKNFTTAERLAGVKHIKDRGAYGLRRLSESGASIARARRQAMRGEVTATAPQALALDVADRRIIDTLRSILPSAALSYEQAVSDLQAAQRLSWRGPATDLREALRETLDHLAPDADVTAQPGFKLEPNTTGPTMKQKVRFILRKRGVSRTAMETPESAVEAVDEAVGTFVRSVYTRSNISTHTPTDRSEVIRVRDWVRTALRELLAIE